MLKTSITDRFKYVIDAKGMSYKQFGEFLGVSCASISAIARGIRPVSPRHIKLICAAFPDVSEEWLTTGAGEPFIASVGSDFDALMEELHATPAFRALATIWLRMSDEDRATLERYIGEYVDVYRDQTAEAELAQIRADLPDPEEDDQDQPIPSDAG